MPQLEQLTMSPQVLTVDGPAWTRVVKFAGIWKMPQGS